MPYHHLRIWRPKDWGVHYIEVEGAGKLPTLAWTAAVCRLHLPARIEYRVQAGGLST